MFRGDKLLVSMIIFLGLFVGLVFAAHVVTTSSGAVTYSINESLSNIYVVNITVSNTDTTAVSNITDINITLPTGVSFVNNTNGTNAGDHVFKNGSNTLNWSNVDLVMNLTTKNFWFNVSITAPGTYVIVVNTSNTTSTYKTNINFTVNDTTAPNSITFQNPGITASSNLSKTAIAVNISATDNGVISAIVIRLFNSTHNQINYSYNASTPKSLFFNFTSLPEGNYYINATVNDTFGFSSSTATLNILLDRTAPAITFNCSATTFYIGDTMTCQCTASDTYDTTPTITGTAVSTNDEGEFSTMCNATDDAGNINSSTISYTVLSDGSGSPAGSSGSTVSKWVKEIKLNDSELNLGQTLKILKAKYRLTFNVNGMGHQVGITSMTSTTVTIEVSSTPQTAVLSVGDLRKFDVNADGYYDISVKLNSITGSDAGLIVALINEQITPEVVSQEQEKQVVAEQQQQQDIATEKKSNTTIVWVIVGVIILIIVIGFVGYKLKGKK